jgi:hypothetical protein
MERLEAALPVQSLVDAAVNAADVEEFEFPVIRSRV